MPQLIEVPNHGVVEFPDDMSEQDIVSAIKKNALNYKSEPSLGKQALTFAANKVKDYANMGFGAIRGAGSIGATVLTPADMAIDAVKGKGLSLEGSRQRRSDLTGGLSNLGADVDSNEFGFGKIAAEIAGTSNIGGLVSKPLAGIAPRLANAISSGGFNLGTQGGNAIANGALRVGGGAVAGGVGAGVINPEDAGTGAMIGGAIPALGKAGYETFKAGGNAIRPFTKAGQQQILTNNIVNMLGDKADDVASRLAAAKGNTPGFNPTAGQVGNSAELAAFERMFKQRNAGLFDDAVKGQSAALANAANGLGGDDLARINLVNAREESVKPLYESAKKSPVNLTPDLMSLMQRPSMKGAVNRAKSIANENGGNLTTRSKMYYDSLMNLNSTGIDGTDAQRIKMALDDMVNTAPQQGIGANEISAIRGTKDAYLNELEKQIPEYLQANKQYKELSKPINQLDIGNEIRDRFIPARYRGGSALDTPLSFNRNALATIFNDTGDTLAKKVTGFKGSTLKGELSPEQFKTIENLVKDNSLVDAGETLGRGLGSPTYQHLAYNSKGEGAGMLTGLLGGKLGMVANLAKGARDIAMTKPLRSMDAQMANMLQNPNSTGALIQEYLTKQNVKQPVINEVLKQYGLLNVPSVLISQ